MSLCKCKPKVLQCDCREGCRLVKRIKETSRSPGCSTATPDFRAFADEVINATWDGFDDAENIQDVALKHGLLKERVMKEPCGEGCRCASYYAEDEWPITCYHKAYD